MIRLSPLDHCFSGYNLAPVRKSRGKPRPASAQECLTALENHATQRKERAELRADAPRPWALYEYCMCKHYSGLSDLLQRAATCGKLTTGHAAVCSPQVRRHNQLGKTGQRQPWIFARRRNRLRGWPLLYPSSSDEMRSD